MLMTSIRDFAPEPGELVEFRVTAEADEVAARVPVHPAPPSFVQEHHIRRRLANKAAGRAQCPWLGVAFDLPGRLRTREFLAALRAWVCRHDTLLTWFTEDEGEFRRYAMPKDEFALCATSAGCFESSSAIRDFLHPRFDNDTDPLVWPPFVAGAILRDTASTVYLAIDHAHTDGLSIVRVFHELRELYLAEITGRPARLPEVGSYVEACALERSRAEQANPDTPEVRRWLEFWHAGSERAFPLELGTEPNGFHPGLAYDVDLFDTARAEIFARVCRAHGAGFGAGIFAALGIAARDLAGHDAYRGFTVVHTRDERRWQAAHGWFVNVVPLMFPLPRDEDFGAIVRRAQQAVTEAGALAGVPMRRAAQLRTGPVEHVDPAATPPIVSLLDIRSLPGSRDWVAARAAVLVGVGHTRDLSIWINRRWEQTSLCSRYPDTPTARTEVPRFVNHVVRILREVTDLEQRRLLAPSIPAQVAVAVPVG